MRQVGGCTEGLGNAIKFGCDDRCTTIHAIKFIEKKKKKKAKGGARMYRGFC